MLQWLTVYWNVASVVPSESFCCHNHCNVLKLSSKTLLPAKIILEEANAPKKVENIWGGVMSR